MYIGLSMMGKESKVEVFMYNLHIISYSVELCSDRDKLQSHYIAHTHHYTCYTWLVV